MTYYFLAPAQPSFRRLPGYLSRQDSSQSNDEPPATLSKRGEIEMAARDIWMDSQFRVQAVLNAFYGLMRAMRAMPGVKHVVLLSSGWPIDERTAASEVPSIGAEAALSNVVIHTFTSESWALSAALSQPSQTIMQDQNLLLTSVEMLSGMTGGLAARVVGILRGLEGSFRVGLAGVDVVDDRHAAEGHCNGDDDANDGEAALGFRHGYDPNRSAVPSS